MKTTVIVFLLTFASTMAVSIFYPAFLVPFLIGILVTAAALTVLDWYLRFKKAKIAAAKRQAGYAHKYDPPIDPMFGKR